MDLAIDVGQIRAVRRGGRPVSEDIREARLRLSSGSPERMMEVALELIESHDLILWHQPPVDRGYALLKPSLRPKASKAKALQLDEGMTVGEAFLASVEGALLHLFANEVPTQEGQPEGIHQSRVAIRRLRAVLRAFKNALPYGGRKAFNYEFRWFQKRMAPARDWHVFLDETIPQMILDGVDEALLEKLVRIARDERRWASLEAARSMSSRRFTRLLLQFERWLPLLQMPRPAGEFEEELLPFARGVLEKTHRDLLIDTRPLSRMSAADLHALRIRGKKARYAGEFFHSLFPPDRSRRQLAELAGLQDLLGEINDASVARLLLTTLKPERLSAETIEAVRDWSGQRVHSRARNAQSRWRRVQKAEPFWHQ
jgi:CHAD domain-containing protein